MVGYMDGYNADCRQGKPACLKQKSEEMIRAHADQVKNIKDVV
jgi:hypothetical protein